MRECYAQDATLSMPPGSDIGAPGAAITVALCGHWQHDPPCPLAPHHTSATRVGESVRLRTLFAVEPSRLSEVRDRIARALGAGFLVGPDGVESRWTLRRCDPSPVSPDEAEHARRLAAA
jgi:hypothetical protein